MLVTLPVIFEANVVRRGARNARLMAFHQNETFEIEESSADEAPIAIKSLNGREGPYTRWHGGHNYVLDSGAGTEPFDPVNWTMSHHSTRFSGFWDKLLEDAGVTRNFSELLPANALDGMRAVIDNNYEARRDALDEAVKGLLLVNGKLYRRTSPPVYVIGGMRSSVWNVFAHTIDAMDPLVRPMEVFRLDRLDDLRAHIEEHHPDLRIGEVAEVIIPDACAFPDEEESLRLTALHCLAMLEDRLTDLDERQGIAWFRLRTYVEENDFSKLADGLYELADACERPRSDQEFLINDLADTRTAALRAYLRWDLRPLEYDAPTFAP